MLSTTSEYAIRALAQLARHPQGAAVLGRDLAEAAGVPPNFLAKILLTLRNAGILHTARGTGGGYTLRKSADQIFLVEIVELFQDCRPRPLCLMRSGRDCNPHNPCTAHDRWSTVSAAFTGFLLSTSLADISTPRPVKQTITVKAKTKRSAELVQVREAKWL